MSRDDSEHNAEVAVVDNADERRYEARIGNELVGIAEYRDRPGRRVFVHTETDPDRAGQGIGGALARAALDDVRARGLGATPQCPFIRDYIERHPEYADLVVER